MRVGLPLLLRSAADGGALDDGALEDGAFEDGELEDDPDAAPDDELDGDADGLLVALSAEAPALACTPSFDIVSVSRRPLALIPSLLWKSFSAAWVLGPITPSTAPGSCPLSFSACWAALTCSLLPPAMCPPDFAAPSVFGASDFIVSLLPLAAGLLALSFGSALDGADVWASAGPASMAPATSNAPVIVHVFIKLLLG